MKLSYKLVADRCMQQRRQLMLAALAAGCTITPVPPALAKYGEFARTEAGVSTLAAGDANNDCLFATPGTGVCQVYRSSAPQIWNSPDGERALAKLIAAADALNALDGYIAGSKWTAISQSLGASRDLREATGFLTAQAGPESAKAAKAVFKALDGVALGAQKKDAGIARQYFDKYAAAMPVLLKAVS